MLRYLELIHLLKDFESLICPSSTFYQGSAWIQLVPHAVNVISLITLTSQYLNHLFLPLYRRLLNIYGYMYG